jgi:aldose 1-epimerase
VEYRIENENELVVEYKAVSDEDTLLDLTQHSYFNLSGNYKRTSLEHSLKIPADSFVEIDKTGMITNIVKNVKNTSFDFNTLTNIEKNIDPEDTQIQNASGAYDHTFILNNSQNIELYDKISGRKMIVNTDAPAVIFYNSTKMGDNMKLTGGFNSRRFLGACLETQHVPNAVNFNGFKVPVLKKGETYKSKTVFKFDIVQND